MRIARKHTKDVQDMSNDVSWAFYSSFASSFASSQIPSDPTSPLSWCRSTSGIDTSFVVFGNDHVSVRRRVIAMVVVVPK